MAANIFANGSIDDTVEFDRAVGHLNITVATGVTFAFSLDNGTNFMSLPAGFHSFPIGAVYEVRVQANGEWEMIAIQA